MFGSKDFCRKSGGNKNRGKKDERNIWNKGKLQFLSSGILYHLQTFIGKETSIQTSGFLFLCGSPRQLRTTIPML